MSLPARLPRAGTGTPPHRAGRGTGHPNSQKGPMRAQNATSRASAVREGNQGIDVPCADRVESFPLCQIMSLSRRLVPVMMARPRSSRCVTPESRVTSVLKRRVTTGWNEPRRHRSPVRLDLEIPADHEKFTQIRPGREIVDNSCCRTIDSCLRRLLDSVRKRLVPRDGHTGVTSRPGGRNWGWRHA